MSNDSLRGFLTSRRAALDPHDVGLPPSWTVRRVPGLRREEVAALAGISAAYYTKLEQGRVGEVSEQVLNAVENALRLDELERMHFRSLVHGARGRRPETGPIVTRARAALVATVNALDTVPAMVLGPRLDVLAVNQLATLLLDDFGSLPVKDRNLARWTFLAPRARVVYPDWPSIAPQVVAALRHLTGQRPEDYELQHLVGEISIASPEFARYWAVYDLYEHSHGTKTLFNEVVGELTLHYETLTLPHDDGQQLVLYAADRGSPSEDKLRLLASWETPASDLNDRVPGTPQP